jgi:hypothetical protein
VSWICCRERAAGVGAGGDAAAGQYAGEDSQADRRLGRAEPGAGGGLRGGEGLQALAQDLDRSDGDEAGEAQRGAASSAEAAPSEAAAAGAAGAGPQSGGAPGGAPLTVDWTSWLKQRMSCACPRPRMPHGCEWRVQRPCMALWALSALAPEVLTSALGHAQPSGWMMVPDATAPKPQGVKRPGLRQLARVPGGALATAACDAVLRPCCRLELCLLPRA